MVHLADLGSCHWLAASDIWNKSTAGLLDMTKLDIGKLSEDSVRDAAHHPGGG